METRVVDLKLIFMLWNKVFRLGTQFLDFQQNF